MTELGNQWFEEGLESGLLSLPLSIDLVVHHTRNRTIGWESTTCMEMHGGSV